MPAPRYAPFRRYSGRTVSRPLVPSSRVAAYRGTATILLLCALSIPARAGAGDYHEDRIPLTLDDGRTVEAILRIPNDATGPLPAIMLFGGFRTATGVLDLVHSRKPLVWATFDYPFEAPRKFVFPDSLFLAPMMRDAIHGTFDGVNKLYAALKQRDHIDPQRITVAGASAGAPFATVGGAQSAIPGTILVHGFGRPVRVIQNTLARKYRDEWGEWVKYPAWLLAKWIIWYCEVPVIEDHAREFRAGQKVLLITAKDDDFIPKVATDSLWTALQESDASTETLALPGGHLGSGKTELIAEILGHALVWMEANGLL